MSKRDSSVSDGRGEGPIRRLTWWFQIDGNRIGIAAGAVVVVFLLTLGLVRLEAITVGPNSAMATVISRLIGGLITLITVTVTINQLILSRVFGTPGELGDQLDENREFRGRVAELTDRESLPTEPGDFISIIGETIHERTTRLQERRRDSGDGSLDVSGRLDDVVTQANDLRRIDAEMETDEVLEILLGTRTAENLSTMNDLRNAAGDRLSDDAQNDVETVTNLLEAVAITSQYYKTLALQQALAQLSRYVTYVGAISILIALYVALIYRPNGGATVAARHLPWVASAGIAIGLAPLAVLLTYVLRIATISRYTLSVGPFVPPEETIRE